jgi:hypothetical protein
VSILAGTLHETNSKETSRICQLRSRSLRSRCELNRSYSQC